MRASFPVSAPPEAWAALADPARLAAALPGARSVERDADGNLAVLVDVSINTVMGLWAGTVSALDADTVRITGSGAPGDVDVTVRANPARTSLEVEGEVSGQLATVGSSIRAAAARRLAETLLANLAPPPPGPAPTGSAPSLDPGPAVRHRGAAGAAAAAAVVTGAVAVVRWRRRRQP
jgi:carbon monoxide dehydrogenase subunit G